MHTLPTPPPPSLGLYLTPRHEELWHEADEFALKYAAPRVTAMEGSPGRVEKPLARRLGERGWFGVMIPPEYGGMGAGHVARTILVHRLARISASAAAILQATLIPVGALLGFATAGQKRRWLPSVADGTELWSIAVTEPWAGGHLGGIETTAEPDGEGGWLITGTKACVGNLHLARRHVVIARTAPPGQPLSATEALTAFVVDGDDAGVMLHPHRPRLGLHGFSLGTLGLDRVRVPADHVLGDVGQGLHVAQASSILTGRLNLGALSLGLHEAIAETTVHFLKDRPRYNGALTDHPVVRDRLGAIHARLNAARTLLYHAAAGLDRPTGCDADLITAKYLGHQLAADSARDAAELHGSHAYDTDHIFQRLWRDTQMIYAPAGTGETQRILLADHLLGAPIQWSEHLAAEHAWTTHNPLLA